MRAEPHPFEPRDQPARVNERADFAVRARERQSVDHFGVRKCDAPRNQRPHAMTEEDDPRVLMFLSFERQQFRLIADDARPSVVIGEMAEFLLLCGSPPMAAQIRDIYGDPATRQGARERFVTRPVLSHSMDEMERGADMARVPFR